LNRAEKNFISSPFVQIRILKKTASNHSIWQQYVARNFEPDIFLGIIFQGLVEHAVLL